MKVGKILTDDDVSALLTTGDAVQLLEHAIKAKAMGYLIAPPRFHVDVEQGSLVFTAGAEISSQQVVGLRVYDTFRDNHDDHEHSAAWLQPGMHINTVGPKFKGRHEVSIDAAARSDMVVTDSLAQIEAYPKPFCLADTP